MSVNILIIFYGIFCIQGCVDAQSADCDYRIKYDYTFDPMNQNKSYYSCYLNTNIKSSFNKVTTINGQHDSGHTDDDVNFLYTDKIGHINTFSSIFCQKFKNLKFIRTFNADIQSIDGNSFENCENLDILMLIGTQFHYIPHELLTRNSKLSEIWFTNSRLTTLSENLFISQNNLKRLYLHVNQINFLPSNVFDPLIELKTLDLGINNLQSIDSKWFKNLINLNWLILDENQITVVQDKSFEFLTNLEFASFSNNRINLLNSSFFVGLHNLKDLSLDRNGITELPQNTFEPLKNIVKLNLFGNNLTVIDAASFGVHNNLAGIYLQYNTINQIDEKFIDNTAVNWIYMEGNICSNAKLIGIENIKIGLKTCFENYKVAKSPQLLTSHVEVIRNYQCGQPVKGVGNIVGGRYVTRGYYPWVAVLSTLSGEYFCGGTLVSSRKVVTAAHCIQEKDAQYPKLAGEIIVRLGIYDLNKKVEVGRASNAVQSINVHPDWNTLTESFDADITVLVLDPEVNFSEFIQPICLVKASSALTGVVVGYGRSEDDTKIHENIPKIIETPIHSNRECFQNNQALKRISSGRTFCGGTGTGVGVCRGDSGNGLFVTDGTSYYLRGVVSSSLIGIPYGCDVDTYSVFTDVIKYVDWINGVSINRFE
ncbi:uncharacterized protein [Chironomus tepperi]|uniref:uncharacterized protein n=1 Tax=Chironomus tepperi TaxID=113505 RepID=UPI00391F9CD2